MSSMTSVTSGYCGYCGNGAKQMCNVSSEKAIETNECMKQVKDAVDTEIEVVRSLKSITNSFIKI